MTPEPRHTLPSPLAALRRRMSLHAGTDVQGTIQRVTDGASLSAENLWLLGCSAIVASIGLDVSSAAVVIGAMLISPLMGPILGVGLAMGVTDRDLLQRSFRELAIATLLSLAVSTVYFLLSPLAAPTPELIARTRPTLLDVGVAFFGGVAGIVAGSRRQVSLALPGVMIATALMPPLCTAGFGLATGNWAFFLGAFYLYGLNAVFIALATLVTTRLLRFPRHQTASEEAHRRERRLVTAVVIIALLPSTWFLYEAGRELRERNRIGSFLAREVRDGGREAYQWEHVHRDGARVLKVYVAGRVIEPDQVEALEARLPQYGLGGMALEVVQSGLTKEDLEAVQGEVQHELLRAISATLAARDSAAQRRLREDSLRVGTVARELVSAFPEIAGVTFAPRLDLLAPDSLPSPPAFFLRFAPGTRPAERELILERSQGLLRTRLAAPGLVVAER
ncbi:MAG TPA: DUF389 domain-containing protein [Gemmatimonadales bacterium]|nr:DUF389 domain-containing protein [Gemmatimonadales bacterium]